MNEYTVTVVPTRAPEERTVLAVDADSTDDALVQAREMLNEGLVPLWTVTGFWFNDEPVVTGMVKGDCTVSGGDVNHLGDSSFQGVWATTVRAPDADAAEAFAVAGMESDGYEDDGSDLIAGVLYDRADGYEAEGT